MLNLYDTIYRFIFLCYTRDADNKERMKILIYHFPGVAKYVIKNCVDLEYIENNKLKCSIGVTDCPFTKQHYMQAIYYQIKLIKRFNFPVNCMARKVKPSKNLRQ